MKQWILNTFLVAVGSLVILLGVSAVLGTNPLHILSFLGNLATYLFFMVGFQICLPPVAGFGIRYFLISILDRFFEERKDIPGWVNVVVAIAIGTIIASVWVWATPLIASIPSLSVWPWEMFRWTAGTEAINYLVAIYAAITGAIGVGVAVGKINGDL